MTTESVNLSARGGGAGAWPLPSRRHQISHTSRGMVASFCKFLLLSSFLCYTFAFTSHCYSPLFTQKLLLRNSRCYGASHHAFRQTIIGNFMASHVTRYFSTGLLRRVVLPSNIHLGMNINTGKDSAVDSSAVKGYIEYEGEGSLAGFHIKLQTSNSSAMTISIDGTLVAISCSWRCCEDNIHTSQIFLSRWSTTYLCWRIRWMEHR